MMEKVSLPSSRPELYAVIGVRFRGDRTYYVKRSEKMANFPGVWSLLSIQFDPSTLRDPSDLGVVQSFMEQMSIERLGGAAITTKRYLTSGEDANSPTGKHVFLHLYEIELTEEPRLNPDYYTEAAWLNPEQYDAYSAGHPCGLCLRLWSDYAWLAGITDRPYVAQEVVAHV